MPRTPGPRGIARGSDSRAVRFCLVWSGKELVLEAGQYFVGSNPASDIVVDDPLVSRRHARLLANDTTVLLEDLRSENGVYVNESRVRRSVRLEDGDRIVIGRQEFAFRIVSPLSTEMVSGQRARISASAFATASSSHRSVAPESGAYATPARPPGSATPWAGTPVAVTTPVPAPIVSTLEADAFESIGALADNMLSLGRAKTAERILQSHLTDVLAAARRGEPVDRGVMDFAAIYAMRLASSLHEPSWVHYVLELHVIFALPVCPTAADAIRRLVPHLPGLNRSLFAGYQRALLASLDRLSLEDIPLAHALLQITIP